MKGLLLLMLTAFSFSAICAISDLQYLPKKGQFTSQTELGLIKTDVDLDYQGTSYYQLESTNWAIQQQFGYGMTDDLYLTISIPYYLHGKDEITWGPASSNSGVSKYKSDGFSDIELQAKKRLFNNQKGILDLAILFSPGLADAESASTAKDGNKFRGGSVLASELEFGIKREQFQVSASAIIALAFSREETDLSDNSKTDYDSAINFGVSGQGRYFINDKVHFTGQLSLIKYGEIDYTSSGTQRTIDQGIGLGYNLNLGYELSKNKALVEIGLSQEFSDNDVSLGSSALNGDHDTTQIGARLTLQL